MDKWDAVDWLYYVMVAFLIVFAGSFFISRSDPAPRPHIEAQGIHLP